MQISVESFIESFIVKALDQPLIVHVVLWIIMFSRILTLETWNLLDDYWKNSLNEPSAVPFQFLAKSLEIACHHPEGHSVMKNVVAPV